MGAKKASNTKTKNKSYNLKELFNQPKTRKDFFNSKRTTNILNKLFNTFTKDEVYYLGKLYKEVEEDDSYNLDKLFKENKQKSSKSYDLDKLYPDYHKAKVLHPELNYAEHRGFERELRRGFGSALKYYHLYAVEKYEILNEFHEDLERESEDIIKINTKKQSCNVTFYIEVNFLDKNYGSFMATFISDPIRYHDINSHEINYQVMADEMDKWIEELQMKDSLSIFDYIDKVVIEVAKVEAMRGGSYIPIPFKTHSVINIKNYDSLCFLWVIIAYFFPAERDPNEMLNYEPYYFLLVASLDFI
jgi:hypothetical protein